MIVAQWSNKQLNVAQTVWSGLQYSLLSEDDKQCHSFVYCKEFVLDVVWATIHARPLNLYGFLYNPEFDPPTPLDKVKMLLRNRDDKEFISRIPKAVKFINKLEDEFGFPHSTVDPCENAQNHPAVLLTSPANWLHAPPLLSLLTLMVRISMIYGGRGDIWKHAKKVAEKKVKPYQYRDNEHLHRSYGCIRHLIDTKCEQFLPDRKDNWPITQPRWKDHNIHMNLHEYGGIVSLAGGGARNFCPAWYKKPEPELSKDN